VPPLLLHSLGEFRELVHACFDAAGVRSVVEIGSETGRATRELMDFLGERDGELWCVEPEPTLEVERLDRELERFHLVRGLSPAALEGIGPADAWVIDGDHNYWTVSRELEHADGAAREAGSPALLVLHDVGWPCARRDHYYAPDAIPDDGVHPHSFDHGEVPGEPEAVDGGFRGAGSYAVALREGGPRNGVLTAVEDFLAERSELRYVHVPAIFGLGVVYSSEAPYADAVERALAPYDRNPLLDKLEQNRLELYLRVLEQQDAVSDLGLRQSRLIAEYDSSLAAAQAEAGRLRLAAARAAEELSGR
jgi:methyltransferase family protein